MIATVGRFESVRQALLAADPLALLLRASLLVVLLNMNEDPPFFALTAAACVVVLLREALLCSPWFWTAAFVGIGARQLTMWHAIDDHIIATTYWCGAIALALGAREQLAALAMSARWLIGCLFVFAAGWKLLSGQFVDGTFFRYSLLFDDRFEVIARLLGGTNRNALDHNVREVNALLAGDRGSVALTEGPRNTPIAFAFTWWGAFIETAVAGSFIAPLRERWHWVRHASLVAFAATTYLIVPIAGFGALLLVLGAAQVSTAVARVRYLAGACALLGWSLVWPLLFL